MAREGLPPEPGSGAGFPGQGPAVRLSGLGKRYREGEREVPVFAGLEALLPAGRVSALVGRSGSGKSTLLNLISGIDQPSSGEVWVGETPVTRLSETRRTRFRRHHVGLVFQFFNLIPTLTAVENVALPLTLVGKGEGEARERAGELLELLGLGRRGHAFPDRLSGGEQQRVAIARAVIHDPPLLLADEPTGNLDWESGRAVLELLVGLARERGRTLVVVTHSAELAAAADLVWTLDPLGLHVRSPGG